VSSNGETRNAPVAFTLPEVSEMTGIPLRTLQDGCRGRNPWVPHVRVGPANWPLNKRPVVMKPEHVEALLANEVWPTTAAQNDASADITTERMEAVRRRVAAQVAKKQQRKAAA
jgi:hypothetical protein